MAIKKILVAVDGSDGADRALSMAQAIAAPSAETHVDLVYVVPIPLLDDNQAANFKSILDMMVADGRDLLAEAREKVPEIADRTDTLIITGTNPATEIIKLIEKGEYDLMVIGSRGLSGIKAYLGSVSHKVLNGSNASVLIAK
ncbi:MAG TPA: universal stress protein [Candidatus Aphodovivens excrementavium]|nr:universal stress protein [Candidatus Aphodovivens excrementavium]